jgi:thiol-disulfide isomerase/thioredoxin
MSDGSRANLSRWAGRALVAALALLFALRVWQLRGQGIMKVTVPRGELAPALSLPKLGGGTFNLADERGHPVVLVFWASWCGPCMHELPSVERVQEALHAPHTTRIIAVNTEGNAEAAAGVRQRLGLTMPIALDDGSASQAYKVMTIPQTVIIDAAGKVAAVMRGGVGEDELMRAVARVEAGGS